MELLRLQPILNVLFCLFQEPLKFSDLFIFVVCRNSFFCKTNANGLVRYDQIEKLKASLNQYAVRSLYVFFCLYVPTKLLNLSRILRYIVNFSHSILHRSHHECRDMDLFVGRCRLLVPN